MNNKHTATPWEILEDIDSTSIMKDGFFVALCAGYVHGQRDTDKANAAFIVRACNAHDDLVRLLQDIEKNIGNGYEIDRTSMCADIIQALAKATHE